MVRVDAKVDGDANRLMQSSTGALLPPFAAAAARAAESTEEPVAPLEQRLTLSVRSFF